MPWLLAKDEKVKALLLNQSLTFHSNVYKILILELGSLSLIHIEKFKIQI